VRRTDRYRYWLVLIGLVVLHFTVRERLGGDRVAPDFLLLALLIYAIRAQPGRSAAAGFVIGPVDKWFKRRSAPDVERADSLGSVEFVPRHRQQIDAESIYVGCDLADGLGGVSVQ